MICVGVFLQEGKRGRVELGIKQIAKRCAFFFFLFFFTCSLAQFIHRAPEHMPFFCLQVMLLLLHIVKMGFSGRRKTQQKDN